MVAEPAVSVCVPTYQGAAYLEECLRSVLAQSHHDFEVLVVDDGSSDATVRLARDFAATDSRVHVVVNPHNLGLVENWNRCIALAKGDWIKFVFQDDFLAPDCLETMLRTASATRRQIVFCMRDFVFTENTSPKTIAHYRSLPTLESVCGKTHDVDAPEATHLFLSKAEGRFNFFGEPTCALVHRDVFRLHGAFDPRLIQLCDMEFWLRAVSNVGFAWCPGVLATFRVHSASTSHNNASRRAFRSSILDRLVLNHHFAYGGDFAAFRRAARRDRPRAYYQRRLARDAFWAMCHARACVEEPGLWLDWEAVAKDLPRLRSSIWQFPLHAQDWVQRNVAWRWRRPSQT